jgi:hypothetical protein
VTPANVSRLQPLIIFDKNENEIHLTQSGSPDWNTALATPQTWTLQSRAGGNVHVRCFPLTSNPNVNITSNAANVVVVTVDSFTDNLIVPGSTTSADVVVAKVGPVTITRRIVNLSLSNAVVGGGKIQCTQCDVYYNANTTTLAPYGGPFRNIMLPFAAASQNATWKVILLVVEQNSLLIDTTFQALV